ncbi:hypothetical protein [Agathobacter ruminis]|uniref:Uncharacterized protein n=1 Tax=Agathobacter ruminis TaxID=1712665 RepID=A0A2G3DZF0_9FIRM|nr:hypothetical protein [Agathobacter ruminis]MDC7300686.1 hypothetical protein [Agathobacter ruminis]PHU36412.1 hypothetical protein CSX02_12590 [Agathobacter ruminis]
MKRFIAKASAMVLVFLMSATTVHALPTSFRGTVYLKLDQKWIRTSTQERSGKRSFGRARTYAVYPADNSKDTFEKMQTQLYNQEKGIPISSVYVLSELEGFRDIKVWEGYLDAKRVYFMVRGNKPKYDAYADFYGTGN